MLSGVGDQFVRLNRARFIKILIKVEPGKRQ